MRNKELPARAGEERHVLLDSAFNSEGVGCTHCRVPEARVEDFDSILSTNLSGVFMSIKYSAGAMLSLGRGSIVTISSIGGGIGVAGNSRYAVINLDFEVS